MEESQIRKFILSGCKFKYYSYDHKKALNDYLTLDEYSKVRVFIKNPNCWFMPEELKEKYKIEKIGSLREIHFSPNGEMWRFKIGNKYAKTFFCKDFNNTVFPIEEQ